MAKRRSLGQRIAIGAGVIGATAGVTALVLRGGASQGERRRGILQENGALDRTLTSIGIDLYGRIPAGSLPAFTQRDIRRARVKRGGIVNTISRAAARIRTSRILRDAGIIR